MPEFKGAPQFEDYIQSRINVDACIASTYCERIVGSVRFVLDEQARIPYGSVKISDNITGCLRSTLSQLLLSTQQQWTPMKQDGVAIKSPELLQVIHFQLEGACTVDDRYVSEDNLHQTFAEVFKIKDDSSRATPMVILPPASIYISSGLTDLGDFKKKN